MELLNGTTLHDKLSLDSSAVSPHQRYGWVHQAIEGVAYLHANSIVHRDLSPRNCLLRNDESVAVGDFGVARRLDDATVTASHERMGSLIYISPQQRENPHASNFGDDVFALGQIAYHLLTGDSPHGGVKIISDLGYPVELEELVSRMRNPHSHVRPQSAEHCLTELRSLDISEDDLPLLLP